MACNKPLKGWYSKTGGFTLKYKEAYHDQTMEVPCGQCMGCRLAKTASWAVRIMHESKTHEVNCFVTLTYDDEHIPKNRTLEKKDLCNFFKRLRKKLHPRKIRYYACGEYGDLTERPHYHAIIFNYWPEDISLLKETGYGKLYQSDEIESTWGKGMISVAECSYETAAYTASYVTKKVTGKKSSEHYQGRQPEYSVQSNRPGIGRAWYEEYKQEVWDNNSVLARGREITAPQYYKIQLKKTDPERHFKNKLDGIRKKETERRQQEIEDYLVKKQKFFSKIKI